MYVHLSIPHGLHTARYLRFHIQYRLESTILLPASTYEKKPKGGSMKVYRAICRNNIKYAPIQALRRNITQRWIHEQSAFATAFIGLDIQLRISDGDNVHTGRRAAVVFALGVQLDPDQNQISSQPCGTPPVCGEPTLARR